MTKANTAKTLKAPRINRSNLFKQFFAAPLIVFLLLFALFPIMLLFVNGFLDESGGFTFAWLKEFFVSSFVMKTFGNSLRIALVTTVICLLIAYPVAYILSLTKIKRAHMIIMLFILPMWINSILRVYAMRAMFQLFTGQMGYTTLLIGLVNDFLPFCVLPIYTVLSKMDKSYMEAAQDLGAKPYQVFLKTVLPLSIPGVISAAFMVFMPTVSTFYMNEFLGPNDKMFGELISALFVSSSGGGGVSVTKNQGYMYALIMLVIIAISVLVTNRFARVGNKRGGLW